MTKQKVNIRQKIVDIAKSYIGIEEIRGNKGFKDKEFEKKIELVGWSTGEAWCSYFGELVWREAYRQYSKKLCREIKKLCSGSAVQTLTNFDNSKRWNVTRDYPVPGSLVIWQHYKDNSEPTWMGHLGVVSRANINEKEFFSCEGNTNTGHVREGFIVAEKKHNIQQELQKTSGLVLKGFIYPRIVLKKLSGIYVSKIVDI